jgi:hypothetical protein
VESLAIVVVFLFLIAFLAGPLSIGLSSQFVKSRMETKASLAIVILNLLRKFFHLILFSYPKQKVVINLSHQRDLHHSSNQEAELPKKMIAIK